MKVYGIYVITNLVTGNCYIGSGDLVDRKRGHISKLSRGIHDNCYLQAAWKKYGKEMFVFRTLMVCSHNDCLWFENRFLRGYKPEYNISLDAVAPMLGRHHKYDAIVKMRVAKNGNRNPMFGRTGEKHPMFGKVGERSPTFGRHHTAEAVERIRIAKQGANSPLFGKTGKQHPMFGRVAWNHGLSLSEQLAYRAKIHAKKAGLKEVEFIEHCS